MILAETCNLNGGTTQLFIDMESVFSRAASLFHRFLKPHCFAERKAIFVMKKQLVMQLIFKLI